MNQPDYQKIFEQYTNPPAPGAVLRRASDIQERKLCWLWPGRIPLGKLTLFAGDPGLGKSAATIDIAARATRGTAWPDGALSSQPGSVILLSAEDDAEDTIVPRLRVAGANLDKVHILQAVRHAKSDGDTVLDHFSLATDVIALQDAAVSIGDVLLVIVDPISAYLGDTDSHVNAKVRGVLAPLAQVAQILRFAVVALDHLSKSNRPALYRPNGSIAFTAAARAVWFFARNPDDPTQHLMLPGKMNLAREQKGLSYSLREAEADIVAVTWGGLVSITADSVLEPEDIEDRSERMEAMDWLRDYLFGGPVPSAKVIEDAKKAGYAERTLRRAKDALGIKPGKNGFEGGWSWQLPEDGHGTPKMATPETWTSSPKLATFDGEELSEEDGYTPDPEGPGCTCRACAGHFGTVGGWKAHVARGRCGGGHVGSKGGKKNARGRNRWSDCGGAREAQFKTRRRHCEQQTEKPRGQ